MATKVCKNLIDFKDNLNKILSSPQSDLNFGKGYVWNMEYHQLVLLKTLQWIVSIEKMCSFTK